VLREDVSWHNGDHFNADDVIYSFEALIGKEVPEWSGAQQDMDNVDSVEKIDDYTVHVTTSVADPIFQMNLATIASYIIPHEYYEATGMEEFGLEPVGTGPYRVVSFTPDERLEIELTEDSWEADEDAIVRSWSNSSNMADPLGAIWTNWGPGSPSQANFWEAPEEFNELGRELGSTLDDDERSELWRDMLEIWMEERPGTPLYNPLESYGVSDRIDWKPIAVPYMDLRNYNLSFSDD
jgi:ABC-type transport system substrate-binding protein